MAIRKVKTKTKGIRYAVRVHVGGGKYEVIETCSTRTKAKEVKAAYLLSERSRDRTTGNDFADFYLEGREEQVKARTLKASTLHHDQAGIRCWRETFGTRTLASIDPTEAEKWARENRWALPPVVTMMNYAVKKEALNRNPFSGLTKKGPGRKHNQPLTVADVDRLAAAAEHEHGAGLRAFVLFTAYSGMRVGEVFALQWSDLDFKANRIHIRRRLYRGELDLPKSNKAREVVLLPEARDALLALDRSTEWVFLGKRGDRMSQSKLTYYWQKIEAAFGRPVQPHELKHFCGHHLYVTMGMPDRVVAVQLGHNDGGKLVRDLYGHGDVGALEEIEKSYRPGAQGNVVPLRKAADNG
jgi:integrase